MLLDQIQSDLTAALKSRDQVRVDTLRFLLGAIKGFEIDKCPPGSGKTLSEDDVMSIVSKQAKTHKESITMFEKGGRQDLVDKEKAELDILQSYLPAQMDESEIKKIIAQVKASNPGADFGALMRLSMAQLKGKADGALVAGFLKE